MAALHCLGVVRLECQHLKPDLVMRTQFLPARLFLLLGFLVLVPAAHAAKPVTVAQLEQILATDRGQSDRHVAGQLAGLTLTERLSAERLDRWESTFPGRRTQAALLLLADDSAFLPLPAADIANDPPPPLTEQGRIFGRVIEYASHTVHNLPNFLATRTTTHFEAPLGEVLEQSRNGAATGSIVPGLGTPNPLVESVNYLPLHLAARSSVPVAYRDGQEVRTAYTPSSLGLTTTGEFGQFLVIVISDAVHNRLSWGYWQRSPAGLVAVFRYQVPASGSHYGVVFRVAGEDVASHPAYHGEIAVDPDSGNIRRLSTVSEMEPPVQLIGSGMAVEYGPVVIGDRTYNCPLRGVAISKMPVMPGPGTPAAEDTPLQIRLNDVAFTGYHLFRAEARILSQEELQRLGKAPASPPQ